MDGRMNEQTNGRMNERMNKSAKELNVRFAELSEVDFLTELRIRDLRMFSDQEIAEETIANIREFYRKKMEAGQCSTLLGFNEAGVFATATVYFYHVMPSNENPLGTVAQITNVWVDETFRRRGIASDMVKKLMELARDKAGMICLNSSEQARKLYLGLGFQSKDNYMVYYC